jgi:hypothetical protein
MRTDHEKTNRRFSKFCERAYKSHKRAETPPKYSHVHLNLKKKLRFLSTECIRVSYDSRIEHQLVI